MSRVAPRSTLCCRPLVVEQGALSGYPGAAAHCFVRACFSHEHWELSTSESDGSVVGQRFGTLAADGLPFSPRGGRSLGGRVSRVAPRSILCCRPLVAEQGVLPGHLGVAIYCFARGSSSLAMLPVSDNHNPVALQSLSEKLAAL